MAAEQIHIHPDMVGEILSWLSVRSLLRFRCVSKLWNSLTREEYFIYSHLERSKSKPSQVILHADDGFRSGKLDDAFRYIPDFGYRFHRLYDRSRSRNGFSFPSEPWRPKLTLRSPSIIRCFRSSLPCNGLLCIYDDSTAIRLCNPATREVQILPDPTPARKQRCSLGFVARTKQYKVVRLVDLGDDRYEIQLLTVGCASWRRVGHFFSWRLKKKGVHVDGTVHWMARLDPYSDACMFCFDLTAEKLEPAKLPDSVQDHKRNQLLCLAPWRGMLALVARPLWPSREPSFIYAFTLQGHYKDRNAWDCIPFEAEHCRRAPDSGCSSAFSHWNFVRGLSFVGDEGTLVWKQFKIHFHGEVAETQIYGPRHSFGELSGGRVYGLYAFQESLVPLEKSAMLCESEFHLEFSHARGEPRIVFV